MSISNIFSTGLKTFQNLHVNEGHFTSFIDMEDHRIINLGQPVLTTDAATVEYVNNTVVGSFVPYVGATQTVNLGSQNIKTTHIPSSNTDLANKAYVDAAIPGGLTYAQLQTVLLSADSDLDMGPNYTYSTSKPLFTANELVPKSYVDTAVTNLPPFEQQLDFYFNQGKALTPSLLYPFGAVIGGRIPILSTAALGGGDNPTPAGIQFNVNAVPGNLEIASVTMKFTANQCLGYFRFTYTDASFIEQGNVSLIDSYTIVVPVGRYILTMNVSYSDNTQAHNLIGFQFGYDDFTGSAQLGYGSAFQVFYFIIGLINSVSGFYDAGTSQINRIGPFMLALRRIDATNMPIINVDDPINAQDASTKNYVDNADLMLVPYVGANATIDLGAHDIKTTYIPIANSDLCNYLYVSTQDGLRVLKAGDTMTGTLDMSNNKITTLADGIINSTDAANMQSISATNLQGQIITTQITNNNVTYGKIQQETPVTLLGNPTGIMANVSEVTLGITLSFSGSVLRTNALIGDITSSANSFVTTIANNAVTTNKISNNDVTYAKIQQEFPSTLLGNPTGITANVSEITLGSTLGFTGSVLQTNAFTGDVTTLADSFANTISNNAVTTAKINNNNVTYAKLQQETAVTLLGNPTGLTANISEITLGSTLAFSGTSMRTNALTGDITTSANSFATSITNGAVTTAKINIDADLTFNNKNITNVASLSFGGSPQTTLNYFETFTGTTTFSVGSISSANVSYTIVRCGIMCVIQVSPISVSTALTLTDKITSGSSIPTEFRPASTGWIGSGLALVGLVEDLHVEITSAGVINYYRSNKANYPITSSLSVDKMAGCLLQGI